MGRIQEEQAIAAKKRGRRGSTNNKNRLEAFSNRGASGGADWSECSPDTMHEVVAGITALGGAITFGLSRDNGAHSLTLMLDGGRETLWYNGDANLTEELGTVLLTLKNIS